MSFLLYPAHHLGVGTSENANRVGVTILALELVISASNHRPSEWRASTMSPSAEFEWDCECERCGCDRWASRAVVEGSFKII